MLMITAYSLRGAPHGMHRDQAVTYNINAIIILGDVVNAYKCVFLGKDKCF